MLKQYCKLNRTDLRFIALTTPVIWLLGFAITLIVMVLLKDPNSLVLVTSVFSLPLSCVFLFGFSFYYSKTYFDLALSFGCTRKQALKLIVGFNTLCGVLTSAITLIFFYLDRWITPRAVTALLGIPSWHPVEQSGPGLAVEMLTPPSLWYFLLPLAAAVLGLICGALVRRFGYKAGVMLYVLFMVLLMSWNNDASWLINNLTVVMVGLVLLTVAAAVWVTRDLLHSPIRC